MIAASSAYADWLARDPTRRPNVADAVLGCATGCGLSEIAPFIRSLRAVFSGQVMLIVDRKSTLLAWLSTHGVETVIAVDRQLHRRPHPAVARFAVHAQTLQERPEVRNVVLADVREVVFQSDPFQKAPDRLHFVREPEAGPEASLHLRPIRAIVGEPLAHDLAVQPRVDTGVVAGPRASVLRFCRTMLLLCAGTRSGALVGLDAAACHVIAHLGLAGGVILPNFSQVAIGAPSGTHGLRLRGDRVINPDDSVSPILHRYSRVVGMPAHVQTTWGIPAPRRRPETALERRVQAFGSAILRELR